MDANGEGLSEHVVSMGEPAMTDERWKLETRLVDLIREKGRGDVA